MEQIVSLKQFVTGYTITKQYLDCMSGKDLIKVDKCSGKIIFSKEVFEKEGLSRNLASDSGEIFVYDFCMLYVFRQNNFELLHKWQLGTDLSSDICGMMVDKQTIYCSIRNGRIVTIDRKTLEKKEYSISEASMWSMKEYENYIVCGTVDGKVLLLNKAVLSVEKEIDLGKQNIRGLNIDHGILYAASQDKKLFRVDLAKMEVMAVKKNAHRKMFDCVGNYNDILITISYPCSEISLWNKDTLENIKEIKVPLQLDGRTYIDNDYLYLSSRNIMGVNRINLEELVK